jgi:hypothetical protein
MQSSLGDCESFSVIAIVAKSDSLTMAETNYMNRVVFGADKRKIELLKKDQNFFDCVNHCDADLVLVSEDGLWGNYELSRSGVDQILTEIDILIIQKSYGKGIKR